MLEEGAKVEDEDWEVRALMVLANAEAVVSVMISLRSLARCDLRSYEEAALVPCKYYGKHISCRSRPRVFID